VNPNSTKKTPAAYGIIGMPLGHSKSPLLHNWGLRECGLPGRYEAWPTEQGNKLKAFVAEAKIRRIKGVSVTIPHKQAIMPLLDALTERAKAVGAVNTLYWENGKLTGDNTDVLGISAALAEWTTTNPNNSKISSAVILGAGGAARAACMALKDFGITDIAVANRTPGKAKCVARELVVRAIPWEERMNNAEQGNAPWGLVINSTPLGMQGKDEALTPMPAEALTGVTLVFDLVYNPIRTVLLKDAEAAGCGILSGLSMFLHQGLAQFRIWTGKELSPAHARQLLLADMACMSK